MLKKYFVLLLLFSPVAQAASLIKIAGAADLRFVMQKLITSFKEVNGDIEFSENYGSSGNFVTQIKSGADFDIFFSADSTYADEIATSGLSVDKPQSYAQGVLVLCGASSMKALTGSKYKKISIANPSHAPYGRIAVEALKNSKVYDQIKDKLVLGENVSQAAQFLQVGAAAAGLIAQSISLTPEMKSADCHVVESSLYRPLIQSFVILKKSKNKATAERFTKFILNEKAQSIFAQNGFHSIGAK